jgi:hypothetical protein
MQSLQQKVNANTAEIKAKREKSTRYRQNRRRRSSKDIPKGMQNLQRKVSTDTSKKKVVKPRNKRQRDFDHSQGNEGYCCDFVCVCLHIHLHDTLHHTFAFINIHLDIHRIIIVITQADASVLKIRLRQRQKEAVSYFVVYEKKGRCFSPSAQKC